MRLSVYTCSCVYVWAFVRLYVGVCVSEWEDLCTFIQYLVIRKWYAPHKKFSCILNGETFEWVCACSISICTYISSDGDTATLYNISNMRKGQANEEKMYTKLVWTYTRIRAHTVVLDKLGIWHELYEHEWNYWINVTTEAMAVAAHSVCIWCAIESIVGCIILLFQSMRNGQHSTIWHTIFSRFLTLLLLHTLVHSQTRTHTLNVCEIVTPHGKR